MPRAIHVEFTGIPDDVTPDDIDGLISYLNVCLDDFGCQAVIGVWRDASIPREHVYVSTPRQTVNLTDYLRSYYDENITQRPSFTWGWDGGTSD